MFDLLEFIYPFCVYIPFWLLWPPISLLTCTCTHLWVFSVRERASPCGMFDRFEDEWSLMVRSEFHRFASADASLLRSYPHCAHKYTQRAQLLWKTSIGRLPMHSDEVWMRYYGFFMPIRRRVKPYGFFIPFRGEWRHLGFSVRFSAMDTFWVLGIIWGV